MVDVKGDVEHSIPLTDVPSQHFYLLDLTGNPTASAPSTWRDAIGMSRHA